MQLSDQSSKSGNQDVSEHVFLFFSNKNLVFYEPKTPFYKHINLQTTGFAMRLLIRQKGQKTRAHFWT